VRPLRGEDAVPLIDEKVQTVGEEIRELARLHQELARAELREGVRRIGVACFLFGIGIFVGGLSLLAAGVAIFSLFDRFMARGLAAAVVAVLYGASALAAYFIAFHRLEGTRSLLLPRTRALLKELLQWRDDPKSS
jgi:uncharacterized membrane protein YqjE